MGDYAQQVFKTKNGLKFITNICYEVLHANHIYSQIKKLNERPQFMINLTNDSWFGKVEPYQHLYLTRWRSLEFALPMIRATNTGISTLIYQDGSLGKMLEVFKRGNLDLKLPLDRIHQTFYEKFGHYSFLILAFIWLAVLLLIEKLKSVLDRPLKTHV